MSVLDPCEITKEQPLSLLSGTGTRHLQVCATLGLVWGGFFPHCMHGWIFHAPTPHPTPPFPTLLMRRPPSPTPTDPHVPLPKPVNAKKTLNLVQVSVASDYGFSTALLFLVGLSCCLCAPPPSPPPFSPPFKGSNWGNIRGHIIYGPSRAHKYYILCCICTELNLYCFSASSPLSVCVCVGGGGVGGGDLHKVKITVGAVAPPPYYRTAVDALHLVGDVPPTPSKSAIFATNT